MEPTTTTVAGSKIGLWIAALAIVVIGGGAILLMNNKEEAVVSEISEETIFASADTVETATLDGKITMSVKDIPEGARASLPAGQDGTLKFVIDMAGTIDKADQGNERASLTYGFSLSDLAEKNKMTAAMDLIAEGGAVYLRVTELPPILPFGTELVGQWIKIDQSELGALAGTTTVPTQGSLTAEQEAEVRAVILDEKLFVLTGKEGEESIDGVATEKLGYVIRKEAIIPVLSRVAVITGSRVMTAEEKAELETNVIEPIQGAGIKGNIWVGAEDRIPRKVTMVMEYKSPGSFTLGIEGEFAVTDLNEKVDITIPTGARSIEEVMQSLYGAPAAIQ